MPILAVNQFGQIYATSPDREDGLGYGGTPECVDQQDLTLGAAYLKSQDKRREEIIRAKRSQAVMDAMESREQAIQDAVRRRRQAQMDGEMKLLEDPYAKRELTRKALMAGCSCEYSTPMSGNVLTANGQDGWAGMSRDQKTIHHVLSGMGANTAYMVDPVEKRQAQMREEAQRILRLKARR